MIRGSRLVLRIYAIGLAQVAALAATLAIAREWGRGPPPPHAEERRFLIDEIAAHAGDRATLDARLRELRQRTGMEVLLQDHSGNVVAGSEPERRHGPGTLKTEWSGGISAALIAVADPPRAPPAEAFASCTLKQAGEKCSVQLGDRELAGTCASGPEQKLFCRPDHPPPPGSPPRPSLPRAMSALSS